MFDGDFVQKTLSRRRKMAQNKKICSIKWRWKALHRARNALNKLKRTLIRSFFYTFVNNTSQAIKKQY